MAPANAPISEELVEKFFEIAGKGDEAKLREFLVENLKKFPQDAQDAIVMAFFEEALAKRVAEDGALSDFRERGLKMADALEQAKKELEKQEKLNKIKGD